MNTSFHEIIPPELLRNISVLPKHQRSPKTSAFSQNRRIDCRCTFRSKNSIIIEMKNPLDKYQEFYTQ
jgi:DNA-binding sugar fermentation-stimulating protein